MTLVLTNTNIICTSSISMALEIPELF